MALVKPAAQAYMRTRIDDLFGPIPPQLGAGQQAEVNGYRDKLAELLADAIIYVKDNAEVVVEEVTGVTPGGGTSGPGTGTLT